MSEVKTQDIKLQTETREAIEFIELLKSLTNDEKNQVKGSKGIQERYKEALKRRTKIFIEGQYLLLKSPLNTVNVAETEVNVTETEVVADNNATKKSKVNKSIYSAHARNKFNNFPQREKKEENFYNSLLSNAKE